MKAQVLTTTRSASAAEPAGVSPSPRREATTLSESTAFFGQPSVSIQNRSPGRAGLAAREEPPFCDSEDAMTGLGYRRGVVNRRGEVLVMMGHRSHNWAGGDSLARPRG